MKPRVKHAARRERRSSELTEPQRSCAVSRVVLPPKDLIRFVLSPDGTVVPDLDHKLPGRGVWLTCDRKIVDKAVATNAFARGLKASAIIPQGLAGQIDALLARRVVQNLALANKAGLVTSGFQKVDSALARGSLTVLVAAHDAALDGRGKLERKFSAIQRDRGQTAPVVTILTIEEISLAIGRPSVVHAGLMPGGLTARFRKEAERLSLYRTGRPPDEVGEDETTIETFAEVDVRLNG